MEARTNRFDALLNDSGIICFLAEAEAAATAACIDVLGCKNQLVEEVVNEVRLRLMHRYEKGRPPHNPESWARSVAHAFAKNMSLIDSCKPVENLPYALNKLAKNRLLVSRILNAIKTAVYAFTSDPSDHLLYDLYYRKKYNTEQIASVLGLGVIVTQMRYFRLLKRISNAVRMMFYDDPLLHNIFFPVLTDRRTFRFFLLGLLELISDK
jgi:hypothetical protein